MFRFKWFKTRKKNVLKKDLENYFQYELVDGYKDPMDKLIIIEYKLKSLFDSLYKYVDPIDACFKEVENNEDKCMNEICGKIKDLLDAAVQLINKSKYRLSGQNRNVRLFQHFVDEHQLWHAFIIYQDILGKRSEPICEVRFKSSFDAYQRILDRKLRKGNTAKKEVVSKGKRTIYYDDGSYNSVEENNK